MMIDVHAHIVYGVDDGAVDTDMSLAMLRDMQRQGVQAVVCTSHSSIDMLEEQAMAIISSPCFSHTSMDCVPIEPVEPKIETLFINIISPLSMEIIWKII